MLVATQARFRYLLLPYHEGDWIDQRLQATEIKNLRHFGYAEIQQIMGWGYPMLAAPIELLEGVKETIECLASGCRLVLLTKGDLFDQESKLARSGLGPYFDAVEVVADKKP